MPLGSVDHTTHQFLYLDMSNTGSADSSYCDRAFSIAFWSFELRSKFVLEDMLWRNTENSL